MARLLSLVASTIRGSVGGITYLSNQYHQIAMRQRTAPVQPLTEYQQLMRESTSFAEEQWKLLTEAEKRNWDLFASTVSIPGPLGSYTVPGRNLFFGWAGLRKYLYLRSVPFIATVYTAPTVPGRIPAPVFYSLGPPTTGVGFTISFQNLGAISSQMIAQVSRGFPNSRNTFKGPFRADNFQNYQTLPGGTTAFEFNDLVEGEIYFVRVYKIQDNGEVNVSLPVIHRALSEVPDVDLGASDGGPGVEGTASPARLKRRKVL